MVDRQLVEDIANRIRPGGEGLIEKDWHVVRAIGVLARLDHGEARPAFSGGTSLSIGWGLIKRFSEDVDFKVGMPAAENPSRARAQRRTYRQKVLDALEAAGFELAGEPFAGKVSGFFSADFAYPSEFAPAPGLRPHLRIEMTFESPALPPIERPIRSLIAQAQGHAPEVPTFPCVDPVETAADKLSALAWRVCVRDRRSEKDDPDHPTPARPGSTGSARLGLVRLRGVARPSSKERYRTRRRPGTDRACEAHRQNARAAGR